MDSSRQSNTRIVVFSFVIMMTLGFIGNLKGVLLPAIKQGLGINYTNIGLMIFISSLGYQTATLAGGFISDRFGHRKVFLTGFLLVTLGIIGIAYTKTFGMLLLTMAFVNLGLGSFDVGLNTLGPRLFLTNTAVMMNIMHLFYGVGSSASPKFAGWMLMKRTPWYNIYTYSLIIIAAAFLLFLLCPLKDERTAHSSERIPLFRLLADRKLWLFIGVLGFSEATEVGMMNWLINFLQVVRGLNESASAQYMFYFFLFYVVGRILGGHIAERLGYIRTLAASASIAAVLLSGGLFLGKGWVILFSMTGPFLSIMFPTMIALISKEFKGGVSSVTGIIMTSAGIICMTTNSLIGKINDSISVFAGFVSILLYALLFILFLAFLSGCLKAERKPQEQAPFQA